MFIAFYADLLGPMLVGLLTISGFFGLLGLIAKACDEIHWRANPESYRRLQQRRYAKSERKRQELLASIDAKVAKYDLARAGAGDSSHDQDVQPRGAKDQPL